MPLKIFAGILAVVLMIIYLAPVVFKLQQLDLGTVVLAGIVMMLVDLWQSLQSKDD